MIEIDLTFQLPTTPEDAFGVLADPRNDPNWQKSCAAVTLDDPTVAPGVGSTYLYVMEMMGRRMEFHNRITEHVEPTRLAYEVVSGPAHFTGTYAISPGTDENSCTVRWTFAVDKGTGFALMPDSLLRKAITKQSTKDQRVLANLVGSAPENRTATGGSND